MAGEDEKKEKEDRELSPKEVESISQVMNEQSQGEEKVDSQPEGEPVVAKAHFTQLQDASEASESESRNVNFMYDVKVHVEVVLGETKRTLDDILQFQEGSVVELDKAAGEPVDIIANGKLIAHAEIVVVDDNFGVKILDIVGATKAI